MDAALGWLGDIVRWFGAIVPRLVLIRKTHGAVKFVRGEARIIESGLHVWWPITTEVEDAPIVRQVLSLDEQTLQTRDRKTVVVDGVLVYSIADLEKFLVENFDAEDNIAELAQAAVREAVLSLDFDEINSGRVKLDHRLTKRATEMLDAFGVEVQSLKLQSFAEGRVLIHAGSFVSVALDD